MAVGEGRCAAAGPGVCSEEEGKSRRAVAGVDGDDDARLLRDQDGVAGDGDAADEDGGSLSLAVLPAEADPNVLLAAGCCCCCSGVVGSDDIPCLRDEDLRKLLSSDCHTGGTISRLKTVSKRQIETMSNFLVLKGITVSFWKIWY